MEQPTQMPNPVVQPASGNVSPVPPSPSPTPPPTQNKSHMWVWILGGCFGIVIITLIAVALLGWWGMRTAKKEIERYSPDMESIKENIERMNKEGEEWEKRSQELRESLPDSGDFSKEFPPMLEN